MRDPFVFERALQFEVVRTVPRAEGSAVPGSWPPSADTTWPACAGCGKRSFELKRFSYEAEDGTRVLDAHLFCSSEHRREFYP